MAYNYLTNAVNLSTGAASTEIEDGKNISSSLASDKCDGDLSSKQVREMGDKLEDTDSDPNSQGGSSNNTYDVNSSSDDAGVHVSTELAVKSTESELERTGDAPSDSGGSLQGVEEKPFSNPPAEVSTEAIENCDMNDSCGMKVEASSSHSTPLEGSSTENSKEIVERNDGQSPIKCMPPSDVSQGTLEMEEKPRQVLKEEETTEEMGLNSEDVSSSLQSNEADPVLVNSDLNCQHTLDEGRKSDETADCGKCPPQDVEVRNRSVSSNESEGNDSSSIDSKDNDAKKEK